MLEDEANLLTPDPGVRPPRPEIDFHPTDKEPASCRCLACGFVWDEPEETTRIWQVLGCRPARLRELGFRVLSDSNIASEFDEIESLDLAIRPLYASVGRERS